jgi:hypothetical protein
MNILQMFVPDAFVFPQSGGHTRSWLVIHKTAGFHTAQEVAQYFQAGAPQAGGMLAKTSVHYVIGLDGTIVQCVREADGAGGNGSLETGHDAFWPTDINLNLVTFSIEHVDPTTDNSTPIPDAQKQASFQLIHDLCQRQQIPMKPADVNGGIAGHFSIDPQSRARCPGNYPWNELWAYLKGKEEVYHFLSLDEQSTWFTDAFPGKDGVWKCKQNGVILGGAHLTYFRWNGGVATHGLPLTAEIHIDQAHHPEVVDVDYERCTNRFDPNQVYDHPPIADLQPEKRVYPAHIEGGEVLARRAASLLRPLQAQITALETQVKQLQAATTV